jgi:hypothetical protein
MTLRHRKPLPTKATTRPLPEVPDARAYRLAGFCAAAHALAAAIDRDYGTMTDRPAEAFDGLAAKTDGLVHVLHYIHGETVALAEELLELKVANL